MKIISNLCVCSKTNEFIFSPIVINSCLCPTVVEKTIEILPNLCICSTSIPMKTTTIVQEEIITTKFKDIIKFNNVKRCN